LLLAVQEDPGSPAIYRILIACYAHMEAWQRPAKPWQNCARLPNRLCQSHCRGAFRSIASCCCRAYAWRLDKAGLEVRLARNGEVCSEPNCRRRYQGDGADRFKQSCRCGAHGYRIAPGKWRHSARALQLARQTRVPP
jgi:hypothetical protein